MSFNSKSLWGEENAVSLCPPLLHVPVPPLANNLMQGLGLKSIVLLTVSPEYCWFWARYKHTCTSLHLPWENQCKISRTHPSNEQVQFGRTTDFYCTWMTPWSSSFVLSCWTTPFEKKGNLLIGCLIRGPYAWIVCLTTVIPPSPSTVNRSANSARRGWSWACMLRHWKSTAYINLWWWYNSIGWTSRLCCFSVFN